MLDIYLNMNMLHYFRVWDITICGYSMQWHSQAPVAPTCEATLQYASWGCHQSCCEGLSAKERKTLNGGIYPCWGWHCCCCCLVIFYDQRQGVSWQLPKHKNCCWVCMYNSLSLIYRWAGISQVMSLLQNIIFISWYCVVKIHCF